jgi:quinol-cytochrome oxidoreductase complex cytochrome b subunit
MIRILSILLELLSLVGLFYGYSRKGRHLMLICGLLLLLGGPIHNHVRGFVLAQVAALRR